MMARMPALIAASASPSLLHSLTHLDWGYVAGAAAAELGSMTSSARSQRRLLQVDGDRLPLRSALGVAFGSTAIANTVPLAGMGMGAAFSYKHFQRKGVRDATVGWALTVSGVMSALTFAALMTAGALLVGSSSALVLGLSGAALNAIPVLVLLAAVRFATVRRLLTKTTRAVARLWSRLRRRDPATAGQGIESLLERAGSVHATPGRYALATLHALRTWTCDCLCLAFAIAATGHSFPIHGFLLAYCTAMTAAGFGLVPGGIGVVEATLTGTLVGLGLPAARAFPAVIVYRVISLGLVAVAGWTVALRMNNRLRHVEDRAKVVPVADQ
jgi:putative heme transporter